jgi:hypothetical protein
MGIFAAASSKSTQYTKVVEGSNMAAQALEVR